MYGKIRKCSAVAKPQETCASLMLTCILSVFMFSVTTGTMTLLARCPYIHHYIDDDLFECSRLLLIVL